MPATIQSPLEPRKSPVQARSAATVDAILDATIQVLHQVGKERLTTTRVAMRAGVSVGTLYQYFPNKTALSKAVLKRHLDEVISAVEGVCEQQRGNPLTQMVTALVTGFMEAKMRKMKTSIALYSVGSDLEGAKRISQDVAARINNAIVPMLKTAPEPLTTDPEVVSTMLQSVIVGVTRRLLESPAPEKQIDTMRQELIFLTCNYVEACCAPRVSVQGAR